MKKKDEELTKEQLLERIETLQTMNRQLAGNIAEQVKEGRKQERKVMQKIKSTEMNQLIAAIAHQWRQPLTVISFILQNIYIDFKRGNLDQPALKKFFDNGMDQIERMSHAIDDLRAFIIPAKEKKPFDLLETISGIFEMMEAQLQEKNIDFKFSYGSLTSVTLFGFPEKFRQVLINMINNAISAINKKIEDGELPEKSGKIRVEVEQNKGQVQIKINNNGTYMPKSVQDRIFEPMYTMVEKRKGKGVGLYMAKKIIEDNMGGNVFARNVKNGVSFVIQIETINPPHQAGAG